MQVYNEKLANLQECLKLQKSGSLKLLAFTFQPHSDGDCMVCGLTFPTIKKVCALHSRIIDKCFFQFYSFRTELYANDSKLNLNTPTLIAVPNETK